MPDFDGEKCLTRVDFEALLVTTEELLSLRAAKR